MKVILIFVLISITYSVYARGGRYGSQLGASIARIDDESSSVINPAGLSKISYSSISAGSSSYSIFLSDSENDYKLGNSSSFTGFVKSYKNFKFSFYLFSSESIIESESESSINKNSESFTKYHSESSTITQSSNSYNFAFAARKSNWGFNIALIDLNISNNSQAGELEYSKTSIQNRRMSTQYNHFTYKLRAMNLSIGHQNKIGNFRYGFNLTSPSYIIDSDIDFQFGSTSVGSAGLNDSIAVNSATNTKLSLQNNTISETSINIGLAYIKEKYDFEFALAISDSAKGLDTKLDDNLFSYVWDSRTDTYTETELDSFSGDNQRSNPSIASSFGIRLHTSDEEKWGFGIRYQPTPSKDKSGTNDIMLAGGFEKKFKNFIGFYNIVYTRALDTGKNKVFDDKESVERDVNLSSSQVAFFFGGSYHF